MTTTTISQGEVHVVPKDAHTPILSTAFTSIRKTYTNSSSSSSSSNSTSTASSCTSEDFNNNNNSRKESRVDQIRFSTLPNNFGAEESSKKGLSLCDTVPSGSNPHQTVIKENPFRRVFAKRKQFYQRLSDQAAANRQNVSAPLWRRNCETTTNKLQNQQQTSSTLLTLNANIEPFAPFVIKHDSDKGMSYLAPPPPAQALATRLPDPPMTVTSDGQNVHYATSTINSEEGVESHLEVSLGKDGGTIKTRHKLLGCSHSATNLGQLLTTGEGGGAVDPLATMQLEYGMDGDSKTLNIISSIRSRKSAPMPSTSPSMKAPASCGPGASKPSGLSHSARPDDRRRQNHSPSSRHNRSSGFWAATEGAAGNPRGQLNYGGPPSWGTAAAAAAVAAYSCSVRTSNSLPNLSHNQRQLQIGAPPDFLSISGDRSSIFYQSYPADEEKRIAFTRCNAMLCGH